MNVKIFTIPFSPRLQGFDDEGLVSFLGDKEVLEYKCEFFQVGAQAYWSLFINYRLLARASGAAPGERRLTRADLTDDQQVVYDRLSAWRLEVAKERGIPPFVIFKNEHLIDFVKIRPQSLTQLRQIKGIGAKSTAKFGRDVLRVLGVEVTETSGPSAPETAVPPDTTAPSEPESAPGSGSAPAEAISGDRHD